MSSLPLEELISQLETIARDPPDSLVASDTLRSRLRIASRNASRSLEKPAEVIQRVLLAQPVESIAIRIAVDLQLFAALADDKKSLDELAQTTKADRILLGRLLRTLSAFGAVVEADSCYVLSASYKLLADPKFANALASCGDFLGPAYQALPSYLASTKYQNPSDPNNTAVQAAFNTKDKDLFAIFAENPTLAQGFSTLMSTWGDGNSLIQDLLPINRILEDRSDGFDTHVAWVDVGGGYGQKTIALKHAFPELQGHFIVQDLPHIISNAPETQGVENMSHDFFTEQPIKGAKAYYLRQVLHDFPKEPCVRILKELRKVMKSGYSKIFIHEQIVPEYGASVWAVTQDFNMMTLLAAAERTGEQFAEILDDAGLKIVRIYPAPDGESEGIIEADIME
ncbi:hypothetical protein G7Y89_g14285 [Cudoniella acicularis]|uniref:O-methyltransferase C-terminal domain-containing protein n=1 Tax=Cudoniella acicularis TaxID=354080 RepID=A0A8H4VU76_9HELO|nr:hypothetical protein G7Y89_g14285 [Cudoniella acicularis]